VRRRAFAVLGIISPLAAGTETPDKFACIWSTVETRRSAIEPLRIGHCYYGVSAPTPEGVDYLAGVQVARDVVAPANFAVREIPAADYAISRCSLAGIGPAYAHIVGAWQTKAGDVIASERPAFEEYEDDLESTKAVRIHIPLRRRPAAI